MARKKRNATAAAREVLLLKCLVLLDMYTQFLVKLLYLFASLVQARNKSTQDSSSLRYAFVSHQIFSLSYFSLEFAKVVSSSYMRH
jgi:hypothetical protein